MPAPRTAAPSSAAAGACSSNSCPPTRPARCTSATAGAPRSAQRSRTCSMPPGTPCSASTTSTMPAGRWKSSRPASGCATWSAAASSFRFPSNGYRGRLHPRHRGRAASNAHGDRRCCGPRARCSAALPPDAPAGDKDEYIDAVIARSKQLLGADGFRQAFDLALKRHPRRHPRRPRRVRRALRPLVLRTQPRRRRRDRSRARPAAAKRRRLRERRRAVVPRHRLRRREGPRGRARERRAGPTSPPTSPITSQARARLRAAGRRARRGSPRLHRARARGPRRDGRSRAIVSRSG